MKRLKIFIMFIICIFSFTLSIKASNSVSLVCNVINTNEAKCKIKLSVSDIGDVTPITINYSINDLDVKINAVGNPGINCDSSKCTITSIQSGDIQVATLTITNPTDKDVKPTILVSSTYGSDSKTFTLKPLKKSTTTSTTQKKKSSNNYLSSISINGNKIDNFSKDKTKYFVNVSNDVLKVTISVELEDENATYDIKGPQTLEIGDNEYTIGVTSEDDTIKFYKVIITRALEEKSSNTNILNMTISGYKFKLDGNSKTYYLKLKPDDKKLNIKVILEDDNATYEIKGNSNLKDGSIIRVVVTAQNDESDTYRIIISKDSKPNYLLYVILGLVLLIILFVVIFIIYKRKNNNKMKKENNEKKDTDKDTDLDKTIEMPNIVNNDEEEKTKIISYEESELLEKTKVLNIDNEVEESSDNTFDD